MARTAEHEPMLHRCKWVGDGAKTWDELIEKLEGQIKFVRGLKEKGAVIREPMRDDYLFYDLPSGRAKRKK
jgi:hypothetical protein